MSPVTLAAHFDGQQIVLDEPYELQPNTPLTIVVQSAQDDEERGLGPARRKKSGRGLWR